MTSSLTANEIEELAESLVRKFYGRRQKTPQAVDIDGFVIKFLKLPIEYHAFAETDSDKIGFIADGVTPLRIYQNGAKPVISPKGTIVLEKAPLNPREEKRRRFTLAHEARILSMMDGKEIGDAIIELLRGRFGTAGEVVAVDGKAVCSTAKPGNPHSALQILSAYVTSNGVILGQEAIHEKTNEIPVFQEMLTYLDVEGKIITADAMHCQRETCRRIIERKGNFLFGLKENQPSLLADVRLFFAAPTARATGIAARRRRKTRGASKRESVVKSRTFPGWESIIGRDYVPSFLSSGLQMCADIAAKR